MLKRACLVSATNYCIAAGALSPRKSRILLICCLLSGYSDEATRKMFDPEHVGPGPDCSNDCRCSRSKLQKKSRL